MKKMILVFSILLNNPNLFACNVKEIAILKKKIRTEGVTVESNELAKVLSYSVYKDCDHINEAESMLKAEFAKNSGEVSSVLTSRMELLKKRHEKDEKWSEIEKKSSELKVKSLYQSYQMQKTISSTDLIEVKKGKGDAIMDLYKKSYCKDDVLCFVSWQNKEKGIIKVQSFNLMYAHHAPNFKKVKTAIPELTKINAINKKNQYKGSCPKIGEESSKNCLVDLKEKVVLDYRLVDLVEAEVGCEVEQFTDLSTLPTLESRIVFNERNSDSRLKELADKMNELIKLATTVKGKEKREEIIGRDKKIAELKESIATLSKKADVPLTVVVMANSSPVGVKDGFLISVLDNLVKLFEYQNITIHFIETTKSFPDNKIIEEIDVDYIGIKRTSIEEFHPRESQVNGFNEYQKMNVTVKSPGLSKNLKLAQERVKNADIIIYMTGGREESSAFARDKAALAACKKPVYFLKTAA